MTGTERNPEVVTASTKDKVMVATVGGAGGTILAALVIGGFVWAVSQMTAPIDRVADRVESVERSVHKLTSEAMPEIRSIGERLSTHIEHDRHQKDHFQRELDRLRDTR